MISHKRDIFDAVVVVVVVKTVNYTVISDVNVDETFLSLPKTETRSEFHSVFAFNTSRSGHQVKPPALFC